MTRKHFVAMADYIRAHSVKPGKDELNDAFIRGMVSLAIYMGRENNPRFDVERFRKACGDLPPLSPR
jgi:hypothetical protein